MTVVNLKEQTNIRRQVTLILLELFCGFWSGDRKLGMSDEEWFWDLIQVVLNKSQPLLCVLSICTTALTKSDFFKGRCWYQNGCLWIISRKFLRCQLLINLSLREIVWEECTRNDHLIQIDKERINRSHSVGAHTKTHSNIHYCSKIRGRQDS